MYLPSNRFLQGGRYRIIRFISSGGFGCTYEAEHVLLKKRVAIKEFFVKDFCNRDEETFHVTVGTQSKKRLVEKMRMKFIDEARSLSQLHHLGIVSVSDVFEENGTAYFVMDYIDGHSLNEIINQEGPLSEERAVRYIRQVAEALQHVHANYLLHLDIKPSNIMINSEDRPVLIDFGTSKQYDELDGENTSTLLGKTPGYAPPEQMSNSVVNFMPATDIYALGATLYKLLTGSTPPDVNLRISGEELEPMPVNVNSGTQKAVSEAMQINKNNRPQTIKEFLELLNAPTVRHMDPSKQQINEETVIERTNLVSQGESRKKSIFNIEMVHVAGGTFLMGASSWQIPDAYGDEHPLHEVTLADFYIGIYEVTQDLWESVMGSNPSHFKGENLPVENVSWNDAQEFIQKLNILTGKKYRLPTEAEWEYAASGGNFSCGYKYCGGNDINVVAWYRSNSGGTTHAVGTKAPNELGIYDMSGNVSEWCQDWYKKNYYERCPPINPRGPSKGYERVLRGGSWYAIEKNCRTSHRHSLSSDNSFNCYGFRLAADS